MNDKYKPILNAHTRHPDNLLAILHAVQHEMHVISPEAIYKIGRYLGLTTNEIYSIASFYPHFRFAPGRDGSVTPSAGDDRMPIPIKGDDPDVSWNIDEYQDNGGFKGFFKALQMLPEALAEEVRRSGLGDMEGADHSLYHQWQHCRQQSGNEKFLIVHAAAAEPQALDVRYLTQGNLFPVLEGMLIAAYAAGVSHGIVCIDRRYTNVLPLLDTACYQMQDAGVVGAGILGSAFNFDFIFQVVDGPVRWGDGHQLVASLEGRRIMECGGTTAFHGCPTVIHSLEILRHLPAIIAKGADWYAGLGVNGYPGTHLITLDGKVRNPGRVEIPMGTPLREIVETFGEGMPEGEMLKAVQIGGPTGAWIPADALDVPLDHQCLAVAGASLGPGIVSVATQGACALDLARQALVYAKEQSCGLCLFCREGTRQMADILTDIGMGKARPDDLALLAELAEGVKLNSTCRLGRTAPDAYLSTLRYFREEYDAHVKEKRCPAGVCGMAN